MPEGSSYYYLDLSLPVKLLGKVKQLETVQSGRTNLEYDSRGVKFIENEDDLYEWKDKMGDRFDTRGKRTCWTPSDTTGLWRLN